MAAVQMSESDGHVNLSHNIYRSRSPSTARMEARISELEERMEEEKSLLKKAQRDNCDLVLECESVNEKLEEALENCKLQFDVVKRRDAEIALLQKERDSQKKSYEEDVLNSKKRHQNSWNDINLELEDVRRIKSKLEKDRSELMHELEKIANDLSREQQHKELLEGKIEMMESHNIRLKTSNEDLLKQISELTARHANLLGDDADNKNELDKTKAALNIVQRQISPLQKEVENLKKQIQDETSSNSLLQSRHNVLQSELEIAQSKADDESENAAQIQQNFSKLNSEYAALRAKHEREVSELQNELEDCKRHNNQRVNELTENCDTEHSRVLSLERTKTQLMGQIHENQMQLDSCQCELLEIKQEFKSIMTQLTETTAILDESQTTEASARAKISILQKDVNALKNWKLENEPKLMALENDFRQVSGKLTEAKDLASRLTKDSDTMESTISRLEREKEALQITVNDLEESLQESESHYTASQNAINNIKMELSKRMCEKDEELENLKRSSHRAVEDLNKVLEDLENKHRTDAARWRRKHDIAIADITKELNGMRDARDEALKAGQDSEEQCFNLINELEEINRVVEETSTSLQLSESRRQTLIDEVESMRNQVDICERNRRKAESETSDATSRISELTSQVNNLGGEKRRLESELSIIQGDQEDLLSSKEANEERIARLITDVARLSADLQAEQEVARRGDTGRRQIETELREANARLVAAHDQSEEAAKESRRQINSLELRVREIETSLEIEVKRSREAQNQLRKTERSFKEVCQTSEEDRNLVMQLRELLELGQSKLRTARRQAEETEAASTTAINKLRKAQDQLEEAEVRATMAERRLSQLSSANFAETASQYGGPIKSGLNSRIRSASAMREGSVLSFASNTSIRRGKRTTFLADSEDRESTNLDSSRRHNGVA